MKPYQVSFHLYAEDQSQVNELQKTLYDLVCESYEDNIYGTALKQTKVVQSYSPIIKAYFR